MLLFKMSKKRRVREVLEARGVIGHDIKQAWEEASGVAVAVQTLVFTGAVAKVGGWPVC